MDKGIVDLTRLTFSSVILWPIMLTIIHILKLYRSYTTYLPEEYIYVSQEGQKSNN